MSAIAVVSLVLGGLLLVALACFLVWLAVIMTRINDTLGNLMAGLRTVAERTQPVDEVMRDVNANLTTVAEAIDGFSVEGQQDRD